MNIIIQSVTLIAPGQDYHNQIKDVQVKDGKITSIDNGLSDTNAEMIDGSGQYLSIGWMDMYAFVGDPGLEHKESFDTFTAAAAAGGFTAVATLPNTSPRVQSKSEIEYLKSKARTKLVDVYPLGALSKNNEGVEITEMYDMHAAGAVGFTEGQQSVQHSGVMLRALQYVKTIDSVILNYPNDNTLTVGAVMHESDVSAQLGLKGKPALAEELMIVRDIELAKYSDSKVHISHVSTKKGVDLIRKAKQEGVKITCSIPSYQVQFSDQDLFSYDSNYKVKPSLRANDDNQAVIEGLKDGTIDVICSNHMPQEEEVKKVEFDYADYGMINLQTVYSTVNEFLATQLSVEEIVNKLAVQPRTVLNIEVPELKVGVDANLTMFDPSAEWMFDAKSNKSFAKNSPFLGKQLKGKASLVINKGLVNKI